FARRCRSSSAWQFSSSTKAVGQMTGASMFTSPLTDFIRCLCFGRHGGVWLVKRKEISRSNIGPSLIQRVVWVRTSLNMLLKISIPLLGRSDNTVTCEVHPSVCLGRDLYIFEVTFDFIATQRCALSLSRLDGWKKVGFPKMSYGFRFARTVNCRWSLDSE